MCFHARRVDGVYDHRGILVGIDDFEAARQRLLQETDPEVVQQGGVAVEEFEGGIGSERGFAASADVVDFWRGGVAGGATDADGGIDCLEDVLDEDVAFDRRRDGRSPRRRRSSCWRENRKVDWVFISTEGRSTLPPWSGSPPLALGTDRPRNYVQCSTVI